MPEKGTPDHGGRVAYYQTQHGTETHRDGRRTRGGNRPRPESRPEHRPEPHPARHPQRRPEHNPGDSHAQYAESRPQEFTEEPAEAPANGFTEPCTDDHKHHPDHCHDHHPDHCHDHCKAPSPECIRRRLMESIALEELSIAHLINAEAEKVQAVAHKPLGPVTAEELVEVDRSVAKVLEMVVAKEQLLLKKLRLLLAQEWQPDPCDHDRDHHRGHGRPWESDCHLAVECDCEYDDDSEFDEDGDCE